MPNDNSSFINYYKIYKLCDFNNTNHEFKLISKTILSILISITLSVIIACISTGNKFDIIKVSITYSYTLAITYIFVLIYQYNIYKKYKYQAYNINTMREALLSKYNLDANNFKYNCDTINNKLNYIYRFIDYYSKANRKLLEKVLSHHKEDYVNLILNKFYNNIDVRNTKYYQNEILTYNNHKIKTNIINEIEAGKFIGYKSLKDKLKA